MPQPITIPRLGWSMEEGIFGDWLKAAGDLVRAGEMVFVLEGEKAAQEIESLDSGVLCIPEDAPRPGDTVQVGQVIGFLLAAGESAPVSVRDYLTANTVVAPAQPGAAVPTSVSRSPEPMPRAIAPRVAGPAARRLARQLGIDLNAVLTPDPTGRVRREDIQRAGDSAGRMTADGGSGFRLVSTPRARQRARELGIDWTRLAGTGRGGRIRERDVLAQHKTRLASVHDDRLAEPVPVAPGRHAPASKTRRILAQRLQAAVHLAVPVTLTTKVAASALVHLHQQLQSAAPDGRGPSYTDLLIRLAAVTLRELPALNASWYQDGIYTYDVINIATAVDTELGLLAPVIHDADRLTVTQIAEHTQRLVAQARSGQMTQRQLEGGTFTISNLGMFEVDVFTPILHLPQAAILGVGRIIEEPVVRSGRIEIGHTLTLSLTFDHRVIDGAPAARWLQRLAQHILNPDADCRL